MENEFSYESCLNKIPFILLQHLKEKKKPLTIIIAIAYFMSLFPICLLICKPSVKLIRSINSLSVFYYSLIFLSRNTIISPNKQ